MSFKLRKKDRGSLWLTCLLPLCLLPFTIKSELIIDKLALGVIAWLSISQLIKECVYFGKRSVYNTRFVFHAVLSMPISILISWLTLCGIVTTYLICLAAILLYNYIILKLLLNCPKSFTLGEVQIISQGIVLFLVHSVYTFKELNAHFSVGTKYDESITLLQLLLLGLLLLVCCLYFFPSLREGIQFHFACFSFAIFMMGIWSVSYEQNVIVWLFEFCTYRTERIVLLAFWLTTTFATIAYVVWANMSETYTTSPADRKIFHFIINLVYIAGILYDVQFLSFASGIVLGVFIILEIYRILDVPVVGQAIGKAFHIFLDEKDCGVLILTHIYLLIGCSCPVWLASDYVNRNEYHLCLMSGIISVGFGDTFAAIGGSIFGKHYWKGTNKTMEGTACAVFAQVLSALIFMCVDFKCSYINVLLVTASILLTSLLEAKTKHVDNLLLPLFMFSFLSWID